MILSSTRTLDGLRPTLMDPKSDGPSEIYWVFSQISEKSFSNLTIITPAKIGQEFAKTYGHYHGTPVLETYQVIAGEGAMILQRKTSDDHRVSEVLLVKAHPGDKIIIPPEYGHSWSNVGTAPLLLYDDWRSGHNPTDYQIMEKLHGMSYYLTGTSDNIIPILNKNYIHVPVYRWIEAKDLKL